MAVVLPLPLLPLQRSNRDDPENTAGIWLQRPPGRLSPDDFLLFFVCYILLCHFPIVPSLPGDTIFFSLSLSLWYKYDRRVENIRGKAYDDESILFLFVHAVVVFRFSSRARLKPNRTTIVPFRQRRIESISLDARIIASSVYCPGRGGPRDFYAGRIANATRAVRGGRDSTRRTCAQIGDSVD